MRWTPASASVPALVSASPSPLSLLLFLLLFFVLFFLSLLLPWFGWDPGWIFHSTFLLLSVAGFLVFVTRVGFVALLRLVDGVMDPLQTCDTEDCAWMTLEDLYCETSWGFSSFLLPYSARFLRVSPAFFTYRLPGSCFEKRSSVLLCLGWLVLRLPILWRVPVVVREVVVVRLARGMVLNSLLV